MAISIAVATVLGSVFKEAFKFGGTFRKEAITVAIAPAVVGVYSAMAEVCADSCTVSEALFAPSGLQWSALITGLVALVVHLNGKRKETIKQGE